MRTFTKILTALGTIAGVLTVLGIIKKSDSVYENEPEEQNLFEGKRVRFVSDDNDSVNADGVRGRLESIGTSSYEAGFYEKYVKRALDIVLSFAGLVVLSPLFLIISILIMIDDPGPVLFTQKRVGRDKKFFRLHKFRSMRMSTPHDVPTHRLKDPESYITRVGAVLRRISLDELPQIWDIWLGNMSVVGPRPALWNQDKLISLRDGIYSDSSSDRNLKDGGTDGHKLTEYSANDVVPGLTGLAQISGRDELELEDKAELDREYSSNVSFATDMKCFFGTIRSVVKGSGVVEGGTGRKS